MEAKVGDRLVVVGHHVGENGREDEILEVHGSNGAPPYLVRWAIIKGWCSRVSDASIEHVPHEVPSED